MSERLKVGDKVYRYEDPAGDLDEYGEYPKPWLNECGVVRLTAKATVVYHLGREVFWYEGGNNRFCRTPEDALKSYIYRKERAVRFAARRHDRQVALLAHAKAGAVSPDPLGQFASEFTLP